MVSIFAVCRDPQKSVICLGTLTGANKALHDELDAAKRELREAYKPSGRLERDND